MKYNTLGRTDISVSEICLGSMTWGGQNDEAEGHAQMDYAFDHGVNFIDTAELYPFPPEVAKHGLTETYTGTWLAKRGKRDDVILATKVAGTGAAVPDPEPITGAKIHSSLDGSLTRLQTDYVDLYQLHWPNRGHYHFRRAWTYAPHQQAPQLDNFADVLEALDKEAKAGRIRAWGLSNETAWGTMQFLRIAEEEGLPRCATMQNEYSLLYRQYDLDMAELSHHEDVSMICYSPLAAGMLSGKYRGGVIPEGSRMTISPELGGRKTDRAAEAVEAYAQIAAKHGLALDHMALAFALTPPFMDSIIIGATTLEQLERNIAATDVTLGDEVVAEINAVNQSIPWPY
ncbi:MAG: aldo/keto reductase [Pseudomonadota bacterium]